MWADDPTCIDCHYKHPYSQCPQLPAARRDVAYELDRLKARLAVLDRRMATRQAVLDGT